MQTISSKQLDQLLDYESLIEALRKAFAADYTVPARHHYNFQNPNTKKANTLLLMPAWQSGAHVGVKLVIVAPENADQGLPAIQGTYTLFDANTGVPLAQMDAPMLTAKRTACASALASSYLSRKNSSSLLMVGTGVLAPHLIRAHAAVRAIKEVFIWGRNFAKATALARQLDNEILAVKAIEKIESGMHADIISVATLSADPLIKGEWLNSGQHLDLVGAYLPTMREADDDVIQKSVIFVDNLESACDETGDLFIPIQNGLITKEDIKADLFNLCKNEHNGRSNEDEITCFKSVGHALEDLAAAQLAFEKDGSSKTEDRNFPTI